MSNQTPGGSGGSARPVRDDLIGTTLGQYEVISRVGRGGMATVYKARQASVGREVAIKVITEQLDVESDGYERFRREVELIARLEHIHVLPIYDFGQVEGYPYLVMRYLDGGSLHARIIQKALDLPEIARLIGQICNALDYAHSRDIVHRDMKPQNVLLDRQGNAYLCDFGIAKVIGGGTHLTKDGEAIGTPSYMAPEQWQGLLVDKYTDIYAVGAMLHEMLTGAPPFQSDNVFSLMYRHLNEPPPLLSARRAGLPSDLDIVIQQAMEKIPSKRYPSAGDLARAVTAAIHGTASISVQPVVEARENREVKPVTASTRPVEMDAATNIITTGVFAGRAWAFKDFEAWLQEDNPLLFIVGPHGIGKSTLAARFSDILGKRVARYELVVEQARTLDPRTFIEIMVAQLSSIIPVMQSTGNALSELGMTLEATFERRILEPLSLEREPVYFVIDGLDWAFDHPGDTIADLIAAALRAMPEALRLIVTGTRDPRLETLLRRAHWLELDPASEANRADLQSTLSTRFATLFPNLSRGEVDLMALIDKAQGNPLYLNVVLEQLGQKRLTPEDLASLPPGLDALYGLLVERLGESTPDVLRLLCTLAAARAPLTDRQLGAILGTRSDEARARYGALQPLAVPTATGWKLSHAALHQWLVARHTDTLTEAHRQIAAALKARADESDLYMLQYLPMHLALAGDIDGAFETLADLNLLVARLPRISLAEVIDDLNQLKSALPEDDARREALDAIAGALERVVPAFTADSSAVFSFLYNELAGVPALGQALEAAASAYRNPWLRLISPISAPGDDPGRTVWSGKALYGLAAGAEGTRWLTASADGMIRLWSGGSIAREWAAGAPLACCALNADASLALTGAEESAARLWEASTGKLLLALDGHRRKVLACVFSQDSTRALTASADKLLRLWDTETGALRAAFYEHPDAVTCCAFSENGRVAISGCADGLVRLWDAEKNTLLVTLKGHRGAVAACAVMGDTLITAGTDGGVLLWDMPSSKQIATLTGAAAGVTALAVQRIGARRILAAACADKTVRVWNIDLNQPLARFEGHEQALSGVIFDADGTLISAGLDGALMAWRLRTLAPRLSSEPYVEAHGAGITGLVFSADGTHLLTASLDRTLRYWQAADRSASKQFKGHTGGINACALRQDGRLAMSVASDKTARLWDVASGAQTKMLTGALDVLTCCDFMGSPQRVKGGGDKRLWLAVAGGKDRVLRVWDADSGANVLALKGHRDEITACACSPTDELLLSVGKDRTARLWSLENAAEVKLIEADRAFTACAFSADGQRILLGLDDGRLWQFERASGALEKHFIQLRSAVIDCGYSADGRFIYSVGQDGTLRLWDSKKDPARPTLVGTFRARQPIRCAAASPDGVQLAAGDSNGMFYLLRLEGLYGGRRKASLL